MGIAQGMDVFLDLAESFKSRADVGFLFVGRGSEVARLKAAAQTRSLTNTLFRSEVNPQEMPGLLGQCHFGLLALDPRHKTHNIPGKFLTYLQAGLPVLARVNAGTDLAHLIAAEGVGRAYVGDSVAELHTLAEELIEQNAQQHTMSDRGRALSTRMFSPAAAVRQIVAAISGH
jgi:glycosyltransferase involved in cell wall biosynthesis